MSRFWKTISGALGPPLMWSWSSAGRLRASLKLARPWEWYGDQEL
ncbi:hypothetical protein J0S82_015507 [Galemys pyrenaicus]|uniref:Uncharacterized protein n=1 Tax=Galemys pyrenaicus TaxID=202257 RepID=A0A8J6A9G5_GALPY|nr:hypothetical protein J0S82_015507 [Galemys pyrenaicus]